MDGQDFADVAAYGAQRWLGELGLAEALRTLASEDADDPTRSCKPFSRSRSGMVLAEGAALVVLESWERVLARGAAIHGEILGYGLTTDSGQFARPTVDGQAAAVSAALTSAGIAADEVDAINAHGTGTPANDVAETAAIKRVFGTRASQIPIRATRPCTDTCWARREPWSSCSRCWP